ncbi:MAG: mandelate racemase/muconate lactonizing enzyme family protein, partial [Thermoplasmatota archaeon]
MKIDSIDIYPISIDRNEIFRIATGSSKTAENVVVKITMDGIEGWGNGTPNSVTKETSESILKAMKIMKKDLEGQEVDIDKIWDHLDSKFPQDRAAIAGMDIALHDALARLEKKNVTEMLGGRYGGVLTDRTIGIMTYGDTVDHAIEYKKQGFKALKIKVGLDIFDDIRRIQAVRDEIGDQMKIWIDANQGYTVQEAITFCSKIEQFDIEFVE